MNNRTTGSTNKLIWICLISKGKRGVKKQDNKGEWFTANGLVRGWLKTLCINDRADRSRNLKSRVSWYSEYPGQQLHKLGWWTGNNKDGDGVVKTNREGRNLRLFRRKLQPPISTSVDAHSCVWVNFTSYFPALASFFLVHHWTLNINVSKLKAFSSWFGNLTTTVT